MKSLDEPSRFQECPNTHCSNIEVVQNIENKLIIVLWSRGRFRRNSQIDGTASNGVTIWRLAQGMFCQHFGCTVCMMTVLAVTHWVALYRPSVPVVNYFVAKRMASFHWKHLLTQKKLPAISLASSTSMVVYSKPGDLNKHLYDERLSETRACRAWGKKEHALSSLCK